MNEKHLKNLQYLEQMKLKEAIKTCIAAGVDVCCYDSMDSVVWLPVEIFKKWFKEYTVDENVNAVLNRLSVVKDGVEYKCYDWKEGNK